jgi:two-component system, NtrC family, sensor kinase
MPPGGQNMPAGRHTSVRLLQYMMVASVIFPIGLFGYASWISYRNTRAIADERIARTLDVLQVHAVKVLQVIERSIDEVNDIVQALSDEGIKGDERRLHSRLEQIANSIPEFGAIWVLARDGRLVVSSSLFPVSRTLDFSDYDYFKAHLSGNDRTFVSDVPPPDAPGVGNYVFSLSKRRLSSDGNFAGVTMITLRRNSFEDLYAQIGSSAGSYYAMIRDDGAYLARFPPANGEVFGDTQKRLAQTYAQGPGPELVTLASPVDQIERRIGRRKLSAFPIYLLVGIETGTILREWRSTMRSHLILVSLPTLFLVVTLGVAVRRTKRLYDEADAREAAEATLKRAQRLESVGQLTSGVAHDFNNLLMIVNGVVARLRRDLPEDKHKRLLNMIETAIKGGESLTHQLLSFSRRQTSSPTVLDLTHVVPEPVEMLARVLSGDIEVKLDIPSTPCVVRVDPSEFEIAILNVAVNARDAMPNGGTLTLSVKLVMLNGTAEVEGLSGEFITLEVADTGSGIPADLLPRVFEAFFTTKEIGKGTGLGLSQVHGFAKQSGGAVTVSSEVAHGTMVTLYLPHSHELAKSVDAHPAAAAPPVVQVHVE